VVEEEADDGEVVGVYGLVLCGDVVAVSHGVG